MNKKQLQSEIDEITKTLNELMEQGNIELWKQVKIKLNMLNSLMIKYFN